MEYKKESRQKLKIKAEKKAEMSWFADGFHLSDYTAGGRMLEKIANFDKIKYNGGIK